MNGKSWDKILHIGLIFLVIAEEGFLLVFLTFVHMIFGVFYSFSLFFLQLIKMRIIPRGPKIACNHFDSAFCSVFPHEGLICSVTATLEKNLIESVFQHSLLKTLLFGFFIFMITHLQSIAFKCIQLTVASLFSTVLLFLFEPLIPLIHISVDPVLIFFLFLLIVVKDLIFILMLT